MFLYSLYLSNRVYIGLHSTFELIVSPSKCIKVACVFIANTYFESSASNITGVMFLLDLPFRYQTYSNDSSYNVLLTSNLVV